LADRGARHGPARPPQRGLGAAARAAGRQDRARSRHGPPSVHADLRPAHQGMSALPASVLFACSHNAIRSPMAEALAKRLYGNTASLDSVGVHVTELDSFAVAVLDEIGIGLHKHHAKSFEDLDPSSFDLIVTLSPEAHHCALEFTRSTSTDVEYWPIPDP